MVLQKFLILAYDIEQTVNTHKLNTYNKELIKTNKPKAGFIKTRLIFFILRYGFWSGRAKGDQNL